jgi:hypothetical protein
MGLKYVFNFDTEKLDIVQDVSGFVPYTGATGDVDLGKNHIKIGDTTTGTYLDIEGYEFGHNPKWSYYVDSVLKSNIEFGTTYFNFNFGNVTTAEIYNDQAIWFIPIETRGSSLIVSNYNDSAEEFWKSSISHDGTNMIINPKVVGTGYLSIGGEVVSTIATGTAPYQCTSTTLNTNLNADLLDGYHYDGLPYLTSVTAHNLLSTTHGDTLADSVVAGDIMYGNATPKWSRLAKGADGKYLKLVSGLPSWETVTASCNWDDVGDPDADTEIAMAGYETTWTSTLDEAGHTVFTISNTDADLANATTLFKLKFADNGDADGTFAQFLDNSGADSMFKFGAEGLLTLAGGISHDDTSATDWTLAQLEQDKDIIVTINDAATTRTAIQVNGDEGSVTMPRQSYVSARKNATQAVSATTETTVIFGQEDTDVLAEYNNSTGVFTAKDAGVYEITTAITLQNTNITSVRIVTSEGYWICDSSIGSYMERSISCITKLSAGGTIQIRVYSSGGFTIHSDTNTTWLKITKVS